MTSTYTILLHFQVQIHSTIIFQLVKATNRLDSLFRELHFLNQLFFLRVNPKIFCYKCLCHVITLQGPPFPEVLLTWGKATWILAQFCQKMYRNEPSGTAGPFCKIIWRCWPFSCMGWTRREPSVVYTFLLKDKVSYLEFLSRISQKGVNTLC